ncbi:AraC family transcriptional regulator [Cohnella silvisoli]|uniref:AraC family transcriptional regulator n=1 Tax=Cohnella silvisoli TaxID=2873699 RepID=A0ABV1KRK4_9BACL|nr:AraC family transcriptional regulator [Cohnella silvisoli]MCD9021650.1 AraC family transcriptional regulator [Cohnella silvisoli]
MMRTFQSSLYLKDPKALPIYVERKVHRNVDLPPVHDHEFYELVYIVHGHAAHYFENKYYPLHAGDMILIQPGQFHTYVLDEGTSFELINCLFLPDLLEREWRNAIDPQDHIEAFLLHPFIKREDEFHPRISMELADARRIEKLLEEMLEEQAQNKAFVKTVIRLKLFELFHLMIRLQDEVYQKEKLANSQPNDFRMVTIRKIHQFLAENSEQKHCIDQLASLLGVSSRHLNRLFKQDTGKTVMEMLHYVRIERAKQLLMHTNDKVVDIAAKVGYEDTSFFTKLFIRKVKCSPGKYREEMQFEKV